MDLKLLVKDLKLLVRPQAEGARRLPNAVGKTISYECMRRKLDLGKLQFSARRCCLYEH
jgi:hypothetical protein